MNLNLVAKAFEEGVKAALKFFQSPGGRQAAAKAAETVMKNMRKAAKSAKLIRK